MKILKIALSVLLLSLVSCGVSDQMVDKKFINDGYPIDFCVVSGNKLGSMGLPFTINYKGKIIKLCCSDCLKEFNTNPTQYILSLAEAANKKNSLK